MSVSFNRKVAVEVTMSVKKIQELWLDKGGLVGLNQGHRSKYGLEEIRVKQYLCTGA
jgi:hypothetical protein